MEESKFGDFEDVSESQGADEYRGCANKNESDTSQETDEYIPRRAKMPNKGQLIGLVMQRLGGNRMSVKATDNKTRNCRVPGKFKRKFWLRPGDAVIIEPWLDDDDKADVVFQYKKGARFQLDKTGILDKIKSEF